ADDGIRGCHVTGVQTCALPIYSAERNSGYMPQAETWPHGHHGEGWILSWKISGRFPCSVNMFWDCRSGFNIRIVDSNPLLSHFKNMTMKFNNITAVALALFLLAGCSINLDENPPHIITSDLLYSDYSGFDTGISGAYSQIRREIRGADMPFQVFVNGTDNMSPNYIWGFGNLAS